MTTIASSNPDIGNGKRAGDTELVRAVRTLLSSTNYVFHTTAFANEVFGQVNAIKELAANKVSTINMPGPPDGNTVLHVACSTKAPYPPNMSDRSLMDHPERYFRVRNDVVKILLEAGANPFLCNSLGQTSIDIAEEGIYRESLVAALVKYRTSSEGAVLSVPPLDASRLMKRSETDTGYAVFSNVCKHCVYYLYKGAILLWDLKGDVQHTVYQPRDSDPKIQALEKQFSGFERRKSIAVRGGMAGSGMWTTMATSSSPQPAGPKLNQEEGERILRDLAKLEAKVPLVNNFVMLTGVDATMATAAGREGVTEWVMCNTGAVVGVRLNEQGVKLHRGNNISHLARKQSQICGTVAEYPEGLTLDVTILHQCPIRFTRKTNASHVCCAMDGLRGKVGYVVAQRNLAVVRAPTEAPSPFAPSPFEDPSTPFGNRSGRGVTFNVVSGTDNKEMEESINESPKITKSFVSVDDGYVFRVASVNRAAFPPKATMGDILEDLCDADDAFDDLLHYTDYSVPQEYGDPICVSQCGDDVFVLFCTNGVIIGDVREVVGGPHATFVDVSNYLQPSGFIRYGVASAPQRFRPIKSDTPKHLIVLQSSVIEVCEMLRAADGSYSLKTILRTTEDRCTPHRFTPFFHGSADELVIAYQSLKKTELSVFNLSTHTMQSICKLPKPSSLRFYQPTQDKPGGAQQVSELPVSVFAIAAQDGQYLLRYNVSMHVMSVYSWDEILQRSAAKKIALVNSVFIRDPLKIKDKNQLQMMLGSRGRQQSGTAASTTSQQVASSIQPKSFPCAWLCVESETLQKYVAKHNLKASELDNNAGAHEQVADNINNVIGEHFRKIVRSAGGKYIEYAPPPFTLIVDEEEGNTQEEIDELEAEYLANRPRHEGVWCATFNDALDSLRVAMQLLRILTNEGKWSPEVLSLPGCGVVEKAYEPKTQLERRHPEFTADPNACQFISRGPPIRPLVAMGDTASSPYELLRSHRMASDVRNNIEMARRNPIPLPPPIETDGVVVMDGALFRTVKPMLDLMGVLPPVSAKVPHVEAPASPTSSPTSRAKAIPARQLCVVAPAELKYRVEPIVPTLQKEPTSPSSKRALLLLHK